MLTLLSMTPATTIAAPLQLSTRPLGTNQLVFTLENVLPDKVYCIQAHTNGPGNQWVRVAAFLTYNHSNATLTVTNAIPTIPGFTLANLPNWQLLLKEAEDSDGDGLQDVFEDLASRTDPINPDTGNTGVTDGYKDPDHDNWTNLQEETNGTDPLMADQPPGVSNASVACHTNGTTTVTWHYWGEHLPDFFEVQRAERRLRPPPEQARPGQPRLRRSLLRSDPYIVGEFKFVARTVPDPKQHDFKYVEQIRSTLSPPAYRIRAHFTPPSRARLTPLTGSALSATQIPVTVQPTANGYALTVAHLIPYGHYLLLVRGHPSESWRASGYFVAGTNREPVHLATDKRGMMSSRQHPIAMPAVRFVGHLDNPQFTAGWGEDSDGDGLPDIYEILVTSTDPLSALNVYGDTDQDGWTDLEEFRRRTDPTKAEIKPEPVILKKPSLTELLKAFALRSDLPYEVDIQIRPTGSGAFESINQPLQMLFHGSGPHPNRDARPDLDFRITFQVPEGRIPRPALWP